MTPRIGNQPMPHNYTYTNNNLQPIVAAGQRQLFSKTDFRDGVATEIFIDFVFNIVRHI